MAKPKRSVIRNRKKKCAERNKTAAPGVKHIWNAKDGKCDKK